MVWRGLGRSRLSEWTGKPRSLNSCPGRCIPAPHPWRPCRPRALGAQDQAADSEAAAPGAEASLPTAWGPETALGPQPPPGTGAAAGRLRPRRPRQEGQDEEEDVRQVSQPRAPPSADVPVCHCTPGPVLAVEPPAEEGCCLCLGWSHSDRVFGGVRRFAGKVGTLSCRCFHVF